MEITENVLNKEIGEDEPLIPSNDEETKKKESHPAPAEVNGWVLTGIQILNSMLGSGILAFPYTLAQTGGFWFGANILIIGVTVLASSAMLIEAGKRKGILNFSLLTEAIFGRSIAQLLNFCIIASLLGCLLTYFNVIGSLGSKAISRWAGGDDIVISSYAGCMALVWACVLPLVMFRSYGDLTIISIGSLLFIVVIVFFVLVEGQIESSESFQVAQAWPSRWFSVLETLGTFAYAASIQSVVFEAYLSTKREDKPLFIKGSLVLAVGLGASLLVLMATFGYGAFGEDCDSDVIANFDVERPAVQFAFCVVVLHLALYIPNAFVIMRLFVVDAVAGVHVLDLSPTTFVAVTIALYAIPFAIMASVPDSDVAGVFSYTIDLTGDLPTGFSCFCLPAALYLKAFDDRRSPLWYLGCFVVALGALLIAVCPVVATVVFADACEGKSGCSGYGTER